MATSKIENNSMDLLYDSGTISTNYGTAINTGITFDSVKNKYKELSIQFIKNTSQMYVLRVPIFESLTGFLYAGNTASVDISHSSYETHTISAGSSLSFVAYEGGSWSGDKVTRIRVYGVK